MASEAEERSGARQAPLALRVAAGIVLVAALAGTFAAFARYKVCDQQAIGSGKVVEVCRHLAATDPPVIAGGLVMLALLGIFFTEVSGFGFTLRREVADLRTRTDRLQGAAQSALSDAQVARDLSLVGSAGRTGITPAPAIDQEIDKLADEYNATRREPGGAPRTSKMTSIFAQMIAALNGVSPPPFDVTAYMDGDDEGRRIAAYAYLYANPDPALVQRIAAALTTRDSPFAQHVALRTIRRQIEVNPQALDPQTRRVLEDLLDRLGPQTDRSYVLRQLLREASL